MLATDDDWTEKLPTDVFNVLLRMLFDTTAHRCLCDRPMLVDVRNATLRAVQLVSKKWYTRYRAFVVYMCMNHVQFCSKPSACVEVYVRAAPRLPLLRRTTAPLDRKLYQRVYKNGRVLVGIKSASALTPGDGTLN